MTKLDQLLPHTRHCSRYLARLLDAEPELLLWLREHYLTPCDAQLIGRWLDALPAENEEQLSRALRQLRKRVMLHVLTRDLNGLSGLDEVMRSMTALAEIAVRRAQQSAMRTLVEQFGQPVGADSGAAQELLVIGMGKLGGGELNVSSDIDLIFVYPEDGETNGTRTLSNHEFFNRLGRKMILLINDLTADGYVFRVDMRLRPYGDSGPLSMSFAALEEYLMAQGREWERYAWIKARVIAPEHSVHTAELRKLSQPFVFRKYLDFGAFDSMRKLHAQIRAEVARRDRHHNIKLGRGGIREIEFIAQVFQLIRGGRDAALRIRPTQQVLRQLAEVGELSADVVERLDSSYIFLRNLEHRLQYLNDQQTQELPEDVEQQAIIASAMGYENFADLLAALNPLRDFVSQQFETVFGEKQEVSEGSWWHEEATAEDFAAALSKLGFHDAAGLGANLYQLRSGSRYRQLPDASRQRLDTLLPSLTALCAKTPNNDDALRRTLSILEAIARRSSYLAFLAEYPQALPRLVNLLSASAWAGDFLTQHPILLDELLDTRELYVAPDWIALDAQLATQLAAHSGDIEREMDALRQFQQARTFHLLAMDLQGLLPLEKLSDHLSDLADLILRHVLRLCWRDARKKHRDDPQLRHGAAEPTGAGATAVRLLPQSGLSANVSEAQFAIIAYGKLGGRELGYASDLDLIFLYDDDHPDAGEIYARLGQRINTMLSSFTSSGRLYEVDLRLRPNGEGGLLVSSIAAFDDYQRNHAWVWEHQALTRARFCAGDARVGTQFEAIRNAVLRQPRDIDKLKQDVVDMRQKMHDGHHNKTPLFDIKHDSGGMVDIEFMVQFLVLAHAAHHPELTANSGNIALLDTAAKLNLIDGATSDQVRTLYRELRHIQHQMRLNNQTHCRIEQGRLDTAAALALWKTLLGKNE
ncbi:MAG: bifunctional [glutamate--ammonia ligase]-adenylyl-L-tyrosine phosphorylase/[glutamate--ammonia-ligase] adenylyltransferase [Sideroxydans sp.]|nr:bifunctional [glutamate--ammonia ligase]-adenylyl-L-tyrosine phosphorylase/[glutamate--ammonia-ligase] adenylyltransferase [Sideroxydans sp.]